MVADHQHVEMLFQRVHRVGHRWVGAGGDHVGVGGDFNDIRGVAAACAFGVKGVDGAAFDGGQGVFDEA